MGEEVFTGSTATEDSYGFARARLESMEFDLRWM
jgi:hypothetical protein